MVISSLHTSWGSWGRHLACQAWWQVPLPTVVSPWPKILALTFFFIFILRVWVTWVDVCLYHMYVMPRETRGGRQIPWYWSCMWVLGIEPRSCGRAVSVLTAKPSLQAQDFLCNCTSLTHMHAVTQKNNSYGKRTNLFEPLTLLESPIFFLSSFYATFLDQLSFSV